jgi:hypothetical protein
MISTKSYSRFICSECHENLSHLSSFRKAIAEKQRELSKFLCRIKEESDVGDVSDFLFAGCGNIELFKVEPDVDPITFEPVVIKTEYLEETDKFPASSRPKR